MKLQSGSLIAAILSIGITTATITGSTVCNKFLCVTGRHNDATNIDAYTLSPPTGTAIPQSSFGWIAIGFGSTMANTPMVITWPNSDGTFTLSQRQASGEVMPTVVSSPARVATLDTSASFSNTTSTSISFSLPASTTATSSLNSTSLIWAMSSTNPGSSSVSARMVQHDSFGTMTIALLTPIASNSNSNSTSGRGIGSGSNTTSTPGVTQDTGSSSSSSAPNHNLLIAHVVLGGLGAMIFIPIGVVIPRIARGISGHRWWFPVHGSVQGVISLVLIIAAWIIASRITNDSPNDPHRSLGMTLGAAMIFQSLLGIFVHWYKAKPHRFKSVSGRGPSNFLHMILGVVIMGIGWATVWEGIVYEWPRYSGEGELATGWKVGWGILVGLFSITYILGLIFLLPRQLRRESSTRAKSSPTLGQSLVSQHTTDTPFEMDARPSGRHGRA